MRPDTVAERNAKLAMVTTIAGLEVLSDDRGELTEEGLKRWRELRESPALKLRIEYKNEPKPGYRSIRGQLVPRLTGIVNPDEE